MKKTSFTLYLLLATLFGMAAVGLSGCGDAAEEEPALYTPAQIRRLLTADSSKVWTQFSEYYLGDSCRTGYKVKFSKNTDRDLKKPFLAHFYKDTTRCGAGADSLVRLLVYTPRLLPFATTDSLVFQDTLGGSSTYLYSTIQLLTSERLQLLYSAEDGSLISAEYRVLGEE